MIAVVVDNLLAMIAMLDVVSRSDQSISPGDTPSADLFGCTGQLFAIAMAKARDQMVVDHADGLRKGVDDHWAAEVETA